MHTHKSVRERFFHALGFEVLAIAICAPLGAWLLGYSLDNLSLMALTIATGFVVDDAIVMIENIARHWAMNDGRSRAQATVEAVAEVGNPTVVATLTVVAALLPMLFVSGLMGPYTAPIPVNASPEARTCCRTGAVSPVPPGSRTSTWRAAWRGRPRSGRSRRCGANG